MADEWGYEDYLDLTKDVASVAIPAVQAYASYKGTKEASKLNEADYNRKQQLSDQYMRFMENPRAAYNNDPALLQARQNRMGDVRAGQLSRTGGTRGGSYARQLM